MMAKCGAGKLQCVTSSMNQPCFSGIRRNASGVLAFNPLGINRWSSVQFLSAKLGLRPVDFASPAARPAPTRCVASSPSPQEPMQRSVEMDELLSRAEAVVRDNANTPPRVSDMEFASSLVSAATTSSNPSQESDHGNTKTTTKKKKKQRNRKGERTIYLLAAIASSVGFAALSAGAVYYRFYWQMQGSVLPYAEILGTLALAIGAAVGMEYWARWAHKALWHDSLWNMHESHHKPREGPFETNDVFAIINAVPAIALMAYGFFNSGLVPGLCFGAGLGITMFGMAYMFVHDGLVHRRFPVGPIADVPYLQKVAAAHQLHHADLFGGVPYGLFLGPQELENVGGEAELQKVLNSKYKSRKE